MFNPPHPGLMIKKCFVHELNLTITESARTLGVSRLALSKIINGHSGISPEMALRLSIALSTSSEMWLNMQMVYDLWKVKTTRKNLKKEVQVLKPNAALKAS